MGGRRKDDLPAPWGGSGAGKVIPIHGPLSPGAYLNTETGFNVYCSKNWLLET